MQILFVIFLQIWLYANTPSNAKTVQKQNLVNLLYMTFIAVFIQFQVTVYLIPDQSCLDGQADLDGHCLRMLEGVFFSHYDY